MTSKTNFVNFLLSGWLHTPVLEVSRLVLVSRPTLLGLGLGCQWLSLAVLDLISSLNDLRTQDETISRPANVAYVMKIKHFFEFVISVMFRKWNVTKNQSEDSDSDAGDSDLVLDSVAQDSFLVLDSEGVDSTTALAHTHSQITRSCKIGLATYFTFEGVTTKLSHQINPPFWLGIAKCCGM